VTSAALLSFSATYSESDDDGSDSADGAAKRTMTKQRGEFAKRARSTGVRDAAVKSVGVDPIGGDPPLLDALSSAPGIRRGAQDLEQALPALESEIAKSDVNMKKEDKEPSTSVVDEQQGSKLMSAAQREYAELRAQLASTRGRKSDDANAPASQPGVLPAPDTSGGSAASEHADARAQAQAQSQTQAPADLQAVLPSKYASLRRGVQRGRTAAADKRGGGDLGARLRLARGAAAKAAAAGGGGLVFRGSADAAADTAGGDGDGYESFDPLQRFGNTQTSGSGGMSRGRSGGKWSDGRTKGQARIGGQPQRRY
jgi:hypothetical protein